jgi:hypothetical protein
MTSLNPAYLAVAGLAVLAAGVLIANRGGGLFRCGWWLTVIGGAGLLVAAIPWLGPALSWLADPPSWAIMPVIALGIGLIFWDFRRTSKRHQAANPPASR